MIHDLIFYHPPTWYLSKKGIGWYLQVGCLYVHQCTPFLPPLHTIHTTFCSFLINIRTDRQVYTGWQADTNRQTDRQVDTDWLKDRQDERHIPTATPITHYFKENSLHSKLQNNICNCVTITFPSGKLPAPHLNLSHTYLSSPPKQITTMTPISL